MSHHRGHPDFAHLRVASAFSARHGTAPPERLVERAADLGQELLALTDRDGVYGMVTHVLACQEAGIRPVLGCDLALDSPDGGRVTLLARGREGWASLCRLVTRAHASPRAPALPPQALAEDGDGVVVLLGPDSDVGLALSQVRPTHASRLLTRWRENAEVAIALMDHDLPGQRRTARALLDLADRTRVLTVLTNAVRHPVPEDAEIAHVLDRARWWTPGGPRPGPATDRAHLASGTQMLETAERLCGGDTTRARRLLAHTLALASSCALDPVADLGMGRPHLPHVPQAGERLRMACQDGLHQRDLHRDRRARERLAHELEVIERARMPAYFLTVADAAARVRERGIRCSIRGSGTGSLVNHLLGVSAVNPLDHGLVMERFLTPSRAGLPDIDLDVESARRLEAYDVVMGAHPGGAACVSMMETYRARSALREVGAALRLPPLEVDRLAKTFPHVRARHMRAVARDLPELRGLDGTGLTDETTQKVLRLAERLDGLPRHVAMHPCGLVLSDTSLPDRVPLEPSRAGYPMVQLDKTSVEDLGLIKLDVIGVRMQSAMAHTRDEVERTTGQAPDLEELPRDDEATYRMIAASDTLGVFQLESPGQRELLSRLRPTNLADVVADISLFRPGPVAGDMVTPYLAARAGRSPEPPSSLVADQIAETGGVVIWHEQVIGVLHAMTGCGLERAEAMRRQLATEQGRADVREEFTQMAYDCGHDERAVERVWELVSSFGAFGFCRAHAVAFALPAYQSAWLKRHHPAAFYAGILTHDPGMYPRRALVADARRHGIPLLGVDVNRSEAAWRVERTADGRWGLRAALTDVRDITDAEVERILAERPFTSLGDAARRARPSREVLDHLVRVGAFDSLHEIGEGPGSPDRRDLLLQASAWHRSARAAVRSGTDRGQLPLPIDSAVPARGSLPATTVDERLAAELEVLGYELERHLMDANADLFAALATRHRLVLARDLHRVPGGSGVLVAGMKVATQTPAVRSGQRVVFATLDDGTGLVDLALFESAGDHAAALFGSWLLAVRGTVRRVGEGLATVTATSVLDLGVLRQAWDDGGQEELERALRSPSTSGISGVGGVSLRHARPHAAPPSRRLWHASPGSSGG